MNLDWKTFLSDTKTHSGDSEEDVHCVIPMPPESTTSAGTPTNCPQHRQMEKNTQMPVSYSFQRI